MGSRAPGSLRLGFAFAMVSLTLAPDFRGCSGGSGGDEPLPTGPFEGCLVDEDCETRMCADVRCLGGSCEVVGDFVDRDGDGEGPAALGCGTDCDDSNPAVRPGVLERCNAIDDDCDGSIDESATSEAVTYRTPVTSSVAALAAWDDASAERFVLFEATSSLIVLRTAALDGTIGTPSEVFRLDRGGRFVQLAALRSDRDVLLLARTDIGAVRWIVLRPGAPFEVLAGPGFFEGLPGAVLDMAIAERPGGWWIAFEQQSFLDETERVRTVHREPGGDPVFERVFRPTAMDDPLDVATLGPGYAVTFEGQVEIREVAASPVVVTPPGPLVHRPLAALDGDLVVGFIGSAGLLSLQRVRGDGSLLGSPVPERSVLVPARAQLRGFGEVLAVAEPGAVSAAVWPRGAEELEPLVSLGLGASTVRGSADPHVAWATDALGAFGPRDSGPELSDSAVAFGTFCGR